MHDYRDEAEPFLFTCEHCGETSFACAGCKQTAAFRIPAAVSQDAAAISGRARTAIA